MRYVKKPVVVEAVQWFKMGDHPAVEDRSPMIRFDRGGSYFYVARYDVDGMHKGPTFWLAVDPSSENARRLGNELPFVFWDLKSGDETPVDQHPDLFKRYCDDAKWTTKPEKRGFIKTLEGGHIVTPGDWIITGVNGEHYPCKPDIFEKTYDVLRYGP